MSGEPPEPRARDLPAPPPARPAPASAWRPRRRARAPRARSALRWSTPVEDVVRSVVADQAVAFWCQAARLLRPGPRVHFLLLPLREVSVPGLDPDPLPGVDRSHWLVWQSLTLNGYPALLPTDAAALAERLGAGSARGGRVIEDGLSELMAALYESRAT